MIDPVALLYASRLTVCAERALEYWDSAAAFVHLCAVARMFTDNGGTSYGCTSWHAQAASEAGPIVKVNLVCILQKCLTGMCTP